MSPPGVPKDVDWIGAVAPKLLNLPCFFEFSSLPDMSTTLLSLNRKSFSRVFFFALASALLILLAGCDNSARVLEETRRDLVAYQAAPNEIHAQKLEESLLRLDEAIVRLEQAGKSEQARQLKSERDTIRTEYAAAKLGGMVKDAKNLLKNFGEKMKQTAESFNQSVQDAAEANDSKE